MYEIMVPFTLTADQVNSLNSTPVVVASFGGTRMLRVPKYLKLWRNAGAAYTVTPAAQGNAPVPSNTVVYHPDDAPVLDTVRPANQLIIYEASCDVHPERADRGTILFRIPIFDLLVSGTTESHMIVTAEPGLVLRPAARDLKIESLASISGGTGSIRGAVFFEETGF